MGRFARLSYSEVPSTTTTENVGGAASKHFTLWAKRMTTDAIRCCSGSGRSRGPYLSRPSLSCAGHRHRRQHATRQAGVSPRSHSASIGLWAVH
jgi:hypothetical protein